MRPRWPAEASKRLRRPSGLRTQRCRPQWRCTACRLTCPRSSSCPRRAERWGAQRRALTSRRVYALRRDLTLGALRLQLSACRGRRRATRSRALRAQLRRRQSSRGSVHGVPTTCPCLMAIASALDLTTDHQWAAPACLAPRSPSTTPLQSSPQLPVSHLQSHNPLRCRWARSAFDADALRPPLRLAERMPSSSSSSSSSSPPSSWFAPLTDGLPSRPCRLFFLLCPPRPLSWRPPASAFSSTPPCASRRSQCSTSTRSRQHTTAQQHSALNTPALLHCLRPSPPLPLRAFPSPAVSAQVRLCGVGCACGGGGAPEVRGTLRLSAVGAGECGGAAEPRAGGVGAAVVAVGLRFLPRRGGRGVVRAHGRPPLLPPLALPRPPQRRARVRTPFAPLPLLPLSAAVGRAVQQRSGQRPLAPRAHPRQSS